MDRATALFHDPAKGSTRREALDDWLASPMDPRQAQVDRDFAAYLLATDTSGES
jgi:hypothetical protein